MKYDWILMDIDDTLIDFEGSEHAALMQAMKSNNIHFTEQYFEVYKLINRELWQLFEKGIYKKNEILTLRFDLLFAQLGLHGDAAQVNHDYLVAMGDHVTLEPGAEALLKKLQGSVRLAIVTNGTKLAQDIKLERCGLKKYFEAIFISDVVGAHKPNEAFFEAVEKQVGPFDKDRTIILGDGLYSDILGGLRYGIWTCWYNKNNIEKPSDIQPDYIIHNLHEFLTIVKA
ncbi:YjjG family noncanonical pyrimidine nucleotidase [Petrocella sp. FN5]|uniref:YjjG family noncanonical pyrimidine nucleotidase n=1 Tax=Petrocella sp. FN5 TaxID=3032002 RepID=UPI0023DA5CA3|nr:YjjG family noncanonical pyrimidine nucleotidase [Petrocella sp. FN5]MDF1617892.1 YjjG family noncanonical pyrimidine nucleotidase [Petrocella sp. FN5]